jgi:hypothetical protein
VQFEPKLKKQMLKINRLVIIFFVFTFGCDQKESSSSKNEIFKQKNRKEEIQQNISKGILEKLTKNTWIPVLHRGWIMNFENNRFITAFDDMDDHIIYNYEITEVNETKGYLLIKVFEEDNTNMHEDISGFGIIEKVDYKVKIQLTDNELTLINKFGTVEEMKSRWKKVKKIDRKY